MKSSWRLQRASGLAENGKLLVAIDHDGTLASTDGSGWLQNLQALDVLSELTPTGVVSLRYLDWLRRAYPGRNRLALVGSNGRKWTTAAGLVEEHSRARPAEGWIEKTTNAARSSLASAGLLVPGMSSLDTDFDGYGLAIYFRPLESARHEPYRIDASASAFEPRRPGRELLERIEREGPEILRRCGGPDAVLEVGTGTFRLMGSSGFTKGSAIEDLLGRVQQHRARSGLPPVEGVAYIANDPRDDRDGWRITRELETNGSVNVGLTVGVDNGSFSDELRGELDIVLEGVSSVAQLLNGFLPTERVSERLPGC